MDFGANPMKQTPRDLSRRQFLGGSAGSMTALAAASMATASTGAGQAKYERIYLPPESELPLKTAAAELAEHTGASVVGRAHKGAVGAGDIILVTGAAVGEYKEAASLLPDASAHREWELVKSAAGGLLIAGSTPRNVCRAALGWIENPERETDRLSVYRFEERFTMWDNALNQWYRFSKGFDRRRHIREIARLGHTGIEINRYATTGGYWVRHRKFPDDSYTWYISYAPALDAFVESSLTRGIYPAEELEANLSDLREAVALARAYGLKPGFVCYEPRCVSEKIFDRYPGLRGSRVDHPGRSLEPRYALDIANPRVLDHYAEMITNLMEAVPDLRYLVFWTEDSGAGIPFTKGLYPGPNGSYLARASTVGRMVSDFSGTLLKAGKKINPEFEVIMQIGWEYRDHERREITAALPEGVTLSHSIGGRLLTGGEPGNGERYTRESREMGKEPYATVTFTTSWEPEPVIGIVRPSVVQKKFAALKRMKLKRIFTNGGIAAPPQCPYQLSQELYAELIRGDVNDPDHFLLETATHWCGGDRRAATLLVVGWKAADDALATLHYLRWYDAGPGQTQARWLTRPVVPDITLLNDHEREAWERALFTLPWDIGRVNIVFEGGIRMYRDEELDRAVHSWDKDLIPRLEKAVTVFGKAMKTAPKPVIEDQHDRFLGYLLRAKTVRNLMDSQVAINNWILDKGDRQQQRRRLDRAIRAEIANTKEWLRLLRESKVNFFRVAAREETPFLYKTPVEDMELKLKVMRAHLQDTPGPRLKELSQPFSEMKLLYYD